MTVSLPLTLEEFVRQKIATGEFSTADEVVCQGLRLLQQQEVWNNDARSKIDLGWEQAASGQLRTAEQVRNSIAERKNVWKKSHPQ